MNTLKSLTLVLSFLISFSFFNQIALAEDHSEDEYFYEKDDYDNDNDDGVSDVLENEDSNQD